MVLDVALVGTGGMMPLPNRWCASVLIRYGRHLVLFDCGEGTQISLRALGWGIKDIDLILISHLHGDHVAGLPGLLLTQGNSGRTEPVDIVGPPGLSAAVQQLRVDRARTCPSRFAVETSAGRRAVRARWTRSVARGGRPPRAVPGVSARSAARARVPA